MTSSPNPASQGPLLAPLLLDLWSGAITPRSEQAFLEALADPAFDPQAPCNEEGERPMDCLLKPLSKSYLDPKRSLVGHDRTALATNLPGRIGEPGRTQKGERLVAALIARGVPPFFGPKPEEFWLKCMNLDMESLCVQLLDHPDCPDTAQLDIEAGATARSSYGNPLLHRVFARGMGGLGQALLEKGMDPNRRDGFGRTPLFFAHSVREIEMLLKAGCDPTLADRDGVTAVVHWTRQCPDRAPELLDSLQKTCILSKDMAQATMAEAAFQGKMPELRRGLQAHPDLDWDAVLQAAVAGAYRTWQPQNPLHLRRCKLGSVLFLMKRHVGTPESRQIVRLACAHLKQAFDEKGPSARIALANLEALPVEPGPALLPHGVLEWMSQALMGHKISGAATLLMGMAEVLWAEQKTPPPPYSWMSLWTQSLASHVHPTPSGTLDHLAEFRGFDWAWQAARMVLKQAGMEAVSFNGEASGTPDSPEARHSWEGVSLQFRLLLALRNPQGYDKLQLEGWVDEFKSQFSNAAAHAPPPPWVALQLAKVERGLPEVAAWLRQQVLERCTPEPDAMQRPRSRM